MKKKGISRSDARMRAVWKSPASALDRSQRMAVKTLQRYGFSVSVSNDGCGFETAAIASEVPEEAAHALEVLNRVGKIRARHSRLSAGMDASARSQLWLLMFDCIGLGSHARARRVVRKREAGLKTNNASKRVPDDEIAKAERVWRNYWQKKAKKGSPNDAHRTIAVELYGDGTKKNIDRVRRFIDKNSDKFPR